MRFETVLPADASAGATARDLVVRHTRSLPDDVVDGALLVVTELATNAVAHGAPEVVLRVGVTPAALTLEVHDGGAPFRPDATPPAPTAVHGRGLVIVAALAQRWGQRTERVGKTVWCELSTHPAVHDDRRAFDVSASFAG